MALIDDIQNTVKVQPKKEKSQAANTTTSTAVAGFPLKVGRTVTGEPGTLANVAVRSSTSQATLLFTIPEGRPGDPGAPGESGSGINLLGELNDVSELPTDAVQGDAYTIDGELWSWTDDNNGEWNNAGQFVGPAGPTGNTGQPGDAATIAVGTVTTGSPGSSVIITNAGNTSSAVFNFTIPRGDVGANGATGNTGPAGPSVWGGIGGDIQTQSDLIALFDTKLDTPGSFTGQSGKFLIVSAAETGLEYSSNLFVDLTGADYSAGTLVSIDPIAVESTLLVGAKGNEQDAIRINGTNTPVRIKSSSFGATASVLAHEHSTANYPKFIMSRSNGNSASHVAVTNGMTLGGVVGLGWAHSTPSYLQSAEIRLEVDAAGTVSSTSMPGRIVFATTPDGGVASVNAASIDSAQIVNFTNIPTVAGANVVLTTGAQTISGIKTFTDEVTIDISGVSNELVIAADPGQLASVGLKTDGVNRWALRKINTAETGSNAGSAFQIKAYDDSGALLRNALNIERDTGVWTILGDAVCIGTQSGGGVGDLRLENSAGARIGWTDTGTSRWTAGNDGSTGWSLRDESGGADRINVSSAGTVVINGDLSMQGGRLSGTALHNHSSGISGTTDQFIGSGTYTPTLTNTTNVAASTAFACQYVRVGNVVTVSGKVNIDLTAGSVASELGISLPIASNFTADNHCAGTAVPHAIASLCARVSADVTNDRANLHFIATSDAGNRSWSFQFTYVVL